MGLGDFGELDFALCLRCKKKECNSSYPKTFIFLSAELLYTHTTNRVLQHRRAAPGEVIGALSTGFSDKKHEYG